MQLPIEISLRSRSCDPDTDLDERQTKARIERIKRQLTDLEAALLQLLRECPKRAPAFDILFSIPGQGQVSAVAILIDLAPKKWTGSGRHALHVGRLTVSYRGMQAPGIVEALDVGKEIPARVVPCGVNAVMKALDLERVEEALHGRVVHSIALASHGRRYLRCGKGLAILVGRILNAAIRMLE